MSLASTENDQGVDEFMKSGFNKAKSDLIKPPRVKKSPVSIECKVIEIKKLGNESGAGNFIICEVFKIHISNNILDDNRSIDRAKIDQAERMGDNWYTRANMGLFEVKKPLTTKGIEVDAIPANR